MEGACCVMALRNASGAGDASRTGQATFLGVGLAVQIDLDFGDVVAVRPVVVGTSPGVVSEWGIADLVDEQLPPLLSEIGGWHGVSGWVSGSSARCSARPAFGRRALGAGQKRRC